MIRAKLWGLCLAVGLVGGWVSALSAEGQTWPWQQAQALITAEGDLVWSPQPFAYQAGPSVRYIDFEAGDDNNDGLTRQTPWKHHPWDASATGNAKACSGVHTYVFKRGVIYRGVLEAKESGQPGNPIRLTSDPRWGAGEACIHAAERITARWTQCSPATAPGIPEPQKVWYVDVGTSFYPRAVWELRDGAVLRVELARDPNWTVTNPDDVKSNWYTWQNTRKETVQVGGQNQVKVWGMDARHLTASEPDAYAGGTVWSEYSGVMGTPYANPIEAYDPQGHSIRFAGPWGDASRYAPIMHCRYFLENLPCFLDSPGEYYYAAQGPMAGRLYLRLQDDRDPNSAQVEVARWPTSLLIRDQSHIHVSGLTFRFGNVAHWYDRWWTVVEEDGAAIKVLGNCTDVRVSACRFERVVCAVFARPTRGTVMDLLAVTDNEILWTDYGAIDIAREGELRRVEVLRNRLFEIGRRPARAQHGHALVVNGASVAHIAGNVLDRCWGAGLFTFGSRVASGEGPCSFTRMLIHHNKVTDPLLNTNDWGGIEFWQGGPVYIYNNISGNPGGYWHWKHVFGGTDPDRRNHTTARFGFAYYLDHGYKAYVFNNVAWAKSSDLTSPLCATAACQEVIGFFNAWFNNAFYRFAAGSRRQSTQMGRAHFLGNLWMDISELFFRHSDQERPEDPNLPGPTRQRHAVDTLAYANNVFYGQPREFGFFDETGQRHRTLDAFRDALVRRQALATQVGWLTRLAPVRDAEALDFRPRPGSAVIDSGVKYFVPWGLSGVVGEWHFYRHDADPTLILDDRIHMARNDMMGHGISGRSFVRGTLEDWTDGALSLNGRDQWCSVAMNAIKARTLDMDTNSFLIEVVFRTGAARRGGVLVSKADESGYVLDLDEGGRVRLVLKAAGGVACARSSAVAVNDGQWHHVVAEVDRTSQQGIALYVDGRRSDGTFAGRMPAPEVSLSNSADFLVGRSNEGQYLACDLDFLRVARGTLAESLTSIEELYAWEFDGPFLKDFFGRSPAGRRRDAGAMEYVE